ncbi:TrgA family protein [Litoreibacter arenae]|uniref:Tellurite resistance protein TrgA n=1 Tax=Litoreibacter arenae DSM 19593 TaxID=1123360 RepID=S9QKD9_9RHOB|nr:TrgA family protein [Litoreibacter arenae]EPX80247.1 Tellurite resistance protein TrgA [Litoreibacter arenae DSM 19593]
MTTTAKMPTAAKLVAGVIFAATGYLVAELIRPTFSEGQPLKWLLPVCVGVPLVVGWRIMGKLVGKRYGASMNNGLYVVAVSIISVTFVFAVALMIKKSRRLQYDGPMEALVDVFAIMLEYGVLLLNPMVLAVLVGGGVIGGLASEWAHRKFE